MFCFTRYIVSLLHSRNRCLIKIKRESFFMKIIEHPIKGLLRTQNNLYKKDMIIIIFCLFTQQTKEAWNWDNMRMIQLSSANTFSSLHSLYRIYMDYKDIEQRSPKSTRQYKVMFCPKCLLNYEFLEYLLHLSL